MTDDDGGATPADTTVLIRNVAPTVDAGDDRAVIFTEPVTLLGAFTDPGTDDVPTIEWNFGDGTTSSELQPTKTYGATGEFNAVLTITDDDGGQGTDSATILVLEAADLTAGLVVEDLVLTPRDPKGGEVVFARFRVFNRTNPPVDIEDGAIDLLVNGLLHHRFEGIDLRAGQDRQLRLPRGTGISSTKPGTFAVQVGTLVETFVIKAGLKVISNLDLDKRVVDVGDIVRISADVTNEGDVTQQFQVRILVEDPAGAEFGQTRVKNVRLTPFPAEGSSDFVLRTVPIIPNSTPGEYTVDVDGENDFFRVVQPLRAAVGRNYTFDATRTTARDAQGNQLDLDPNGQVSFTTGSIALSIPVRAARGVKVNSFVDTTSGISIIDHHRQGC